MGDQIKDSNAGSRKGYIIIESVIKLCFQDPNAQYVCKGALQEHVACICNEAEFEVACINAQFVDVHAFHYLNTNYR